MLAVPAIAATDQVTGRGGDRHVRGGCRRPDAVEAVRRDADDRVSPAADPKLLSNHRAITAESGLPVSVAEYGDPCPVRHAVLVGGEVPADGRAGVEQRPEAGAHECHRRRFGGSAGPEELLVVLKDGRRGGEGPRVITQLRIAEIADVAVDALRAVSIRAAQVDPP